MQHFVTIWGYFQKTLCQGTTKAVRDMETVGIGLPVLISAKL